MGWNAAHEAISSTRLPRSMYGSARSVSSAAARQFSAIMRPVVAAPMSAAIPMRPKPAALTRYRTTRGSAESAAESSSNAASCVRSSTKMRHSTASSAESSRSRSPRRATSQSSSTASRARSLANSRPSPLDAPVMSAMHFLLVIIFSLRLFIISHDQKDHACILYL